MQTKRHKQFDFSFYLSHRYLPATLICTTKEPTCSLYWLMLFSVDVVSGDGSTYEIGIAVILEMLIETLIDTYHVRTCSIGTIQCIIYTLLAHVIARLCLIARVIKNGYYYNIIFSPSHIEGSSTSVGRPGNCQSPVLYHYNNYFHYYHFQNRHYWYYYYAY